MTTRTRFAFWLFALALFCGLEAPSQAIPLFRNKIQKKAAVSASLTLTPANSNRIYLSVRAAGNESLEPENAGATGQVQMRQGKIRLVGAITHLAFADKNHATAFADMSLNGSPAQIRLDMAKQQDGKNVVSFEIRDAQGALLLASGPQVAQQGFLQITH